MNSIREIRLKIAELFEIDAQSGDEVKDLGAITMYVLKHYAFLPKPILVRIEGDEVHLEAVDSKSVLLAGVPQSIYRETGAPSMAVASSQTELRAIGSRHLGLLIRAAAKWVSRLP